MENFRFAGLFLGFRARWKHFDFERPDIMNRLFLTDAAKAAFSDQPQTIVVKIGTASFSLPDGTPRMEVLEPLADQLVALRKTGQRVFLVSSGAIGLGRRKIGWTGPLSEDQKGVAAMVGQSADSSLFRAVRTARFSAPAAQGLVRHQPSVRQRYAFALHYHIKPFEHGC